MATDEEWKHMKRDVTIHISPSTSLIDCAKYLHGMQNRGITVVQLFMILKEFREFNMDYIFLTPSVISHLASYGAHATYKEDVANEPIKSDREIFLEKMENFTSSDQNAVEFVKMIKNEIENGTFNCYAMG